MYNFLKNLFAKPLLEKGLGAEINPIDNRDIKLASFQSEVTLPYAYETDISILPVQDQKAHGSCVGQAEGTIIAYFDFIENQKNDVSRRFLYAESKLEDGIPDIQGTYPRVTSGIIYKNGATTSKIVPDNNSLPYNEYLTIPSREEALKEAKMRKATYAFPEIDIDSLKNAIFTNKLVSISILVDWKAFSKAKLGVPSRIVGGHRVMLYGFEGDTFYFRNSWGTSWGDSGNGSFDYETYKNYIYDPICYVDIPNEILEETKKDYRFMTTMRYGSKGYEVKKLQERLGITADGIFGRGTEKTVKNFQVQNGLVADGIVGPNMRKVLNLNTKSMIEIWAGAIKAHEGYYEGSRSYRNCNPGNFRNSSSNFMESLGATGSDKDGFAIFPTYEIGFKALCTFLTMACENRLSAYRGNMTILDFFSVYAPASDNNNTVAYAKAVAKALGTMITTKIEELL